MDNSYLIIDVDGTLTDGGIYYDSAGNEEKRFCVKDGLGIICALELGIKVIILTGRKSMATQKRMEELGVSHISQGIKDKEKYIRKLIRDDNVSRSSLYYIGDDINDYCAMRLCGFVACPNDASREVKEIANYVASKKGGDGAVREIIEYVLKKRGLWDLAINSRYGVPLC